MIKIYFVFLTIIVLIAVVVTGCGTKKVAEEVPTTACQPEDIEVAVNDGSMDVYWQDNCDQLISGYNIYVSEDPLTEKYSGTSLPESIKPNNLVTYAGDTNPEDGVVHYPTENLENGKKYYVSVRIVNPDRTLSKPSNEVLAVCGPRGEIELSIRYKSEQDGYSFDQNQYVRADNIDNDLYFYSRDGVDQLASPNKLDGFLRISKLAKLSFTGDFTELKSNLSVLVDNPSGDKVDVAKGDWVQIQTPENRTALVQVLDIFGSGEERRIKLFFAYSPISGEPIF